MVYIFDIYLFVFGILVGQQMPNLRKRGFSFCSNPLPRSYWF